MSVDEGRQGQVAQRNALRAREEVADYPGRARAARLYKRIARRAERRARRQAAIAAAHCGDW
jgi:hypothetical protein